MIQGGKVTLRDGQTIVYQNVKMEQEIESVRDPLQPTLIVEMTP